VTYTETLSKMAGRWWQALALLMPAPSATMPATFQEQPQPVIRTREMAAGEESVLAEIFVSSVRELGSQAYSPEQVAVWSSFGQHFAEFQARLSGGVVVVAEGAVPGETGPARILGFGQLEQAGHLSLLYTCPTASRQGVATRVYADLETAARREGVTRIHTEASHLSRGFFGKQGFDLVEKEVVERGGQSFERFRMAKVLDMERGRPGPARARE
jgi:putative acetyltransferase